jgi:hypothetical protein
LSGLIARAQPVDGGIDVEPVELSPALSADQLFNTPAGNHVRIVGGTIPVDAAVLPSPIGDAVNVPSVPANALCNVIVDAIPVEHEGAPGGFIPGIPELAHSFGDVSWAVPISGSEGTEGNVLWSVLLKGGACVTAADSTAYVLSSTAEMRPFTKPLTEWKCRLLRAQISVVEEVDGQQVQVTKTVSACDERVDLARDKLSIPHAWAGRHLLNFRKVDSGVLQDRVKKAVKAIKEIR